MRDESTPIRRFMNGLKLAWMLSKRDLKNRYASSYVGVAWNIGVPLLNSIITVVVFSILMRGRISGYQGEIPFALFYFVPFSIWTVFTEVTNRSTGILREYSYLINKIAFPSWVLPLVPIASALLSQAIVFGIVGTLLLWKGIAVANMAWAYLLIWALAIVITLACAYAFSAIAAYIPDTAQIVPVALNALFWVTPILYPATMVSGGSQLRWVKDIILWSNPFFYLTEGARVAVFGGPEFPWRQLAIVAVAAAALLAGGIFVFRKLRTGFADVL